jgi:hypothetical protein
LYISSLKGFICINFSHIIIISFLIFKIISPVFNICFAILFVAILISIKYNEDRYYENVYYAKIAGISSRELKNIEYDFLVIINFELFISEDEYLKYKKYLENFYEQLNE